MIDVAKYQEQCKGPGKFELEHQACPYFYAQWLDGDGEAWSPLPDYDGEDGYGEVTLFESSAEEIDALDCDNWVGFTVDSQGFVIFKQAKDRDVLENHWTQYFGV